MDESVLGWRPLAEAWLANRSPQESHVSIYQGPLCDTTVSNAAKCRLQAQAYTKFSQHIYFTTRRVSEFGIPDLTFAILLVHL